MTFVYRNPGKPGKAKIPPAPEGMRWCAGCKAFMSIERFAKPSGDYYKGSYCIPCRDLYGANYMTKTERHRANNNAAAKRRYALKKAAGPEPTKEEITALFSKYNGLCVACKVHRATHLDHVVPLVNGGINAVSNRQPLCSICNNRKFVNGRDYRDPGDS